MAIFNSYVKLPEGISTVFHYSHLYLYVTKALCTHVEKTIAKLRSYNLCAPDPHVARGFG